MNIIEKAKVTVKEHKKAFIGASMAAGAIASAGVGYLCGVRITNGKWNEVCNLAAFGEEAVKLTYGPTGDKYDMVLTKVVETVEEVVEI
jgi:hypothetical protein